ncbi:exodeoxyribonuclease V subunit gamma [Chitinolyticbacter meiyuanensis]|uniref:exodeoxyribonuclease V subunit gamma n=1 Tax=Chitinolyticbacter meiyuanensis TaxID=682798 RepID=UPI0011E605A9|nr:exodeoxyribonuclease V subunit gamma [Chitinolyticbacter meiyuanensis]
MPASAPLTPGLMIVHGNRLEELRALAVSWLRAYPLAPLENEVVLVFSNGIAQWLKLALAEDPEAGGCGIAAALDIQLPARFLWQAYRTVLGRDAVPESSPLDKAPLTWRLMRLLPALCDRPEFAALARFLEDDADLRHRHQLAERLADLFDQYQVYRADWLAAWAHGHDEIATRAGLRALTEDERWQAALWRMLLADLGEIGSGRAGVHQAFVAALAGHDTVPPGLPRRVVVFGLSSLPAQAVEALAALSRHCQVLLAVHNPCRYYWGDIVEDKALLRTRHRHAAKPGLALLDEALVHQHAQPLLAAWGKQGRDYINLLDQFDDTATYRDLFRALSGERIDLFTEPGTATLLGQLQHDILELRPLNETRARWPAIDTARDASIRFHVAHSAQREVEILHDQLLAHFSADPTLRPRDVIVMVPDINAYAPHIAAVFGQIAPSDARYIPYTLADQGQRGRAPLLIALEHLLQLPESRFAASEVLDLLEVPALRRRFGIAESDLPTLQRWITGSGIRWGLDAAQRATLGLPGGVTQNSWRFGLARMLLGYAVGSAEPLDQIAPYDEIAGLDAALVGPLHALVEALALARDELAIPATPTGWGERLMALLPLFFEAGDDEEQALVAQLQQLLDDWLALCEAAALTELLPLTVVREAWLAGLDAGGLSQRFLAGAVNCCTLMPMRAIPFKVVCLLGMNDGDYPRIQPPLDFDLMARDYRPGDRSRRDDDRYLWLEALLSARDVLYISWVGRSARDNSERAASVLVGQLRDHLASGWRSADGSELLHALTTEHPLQPFSPRYFDGEHGLVSYAREWLSAHEAAPEAVAGPLPPFQPDAALNLATLRRFLRNPVEAFFAERLKVVLDEVAHDDSDDEPFALDGLARHQLAEAMLSEALQMDEAEAAIARGAARLRLAGALPVGGFGALAEQALSAPLAAQVARYRALQAEWPQADPSPLALQFVHGDIVLETWQGSVRRNVLGEPALLLPLTGDLLREGKPKWHRLLDAWFTGLMANACGEPLQVYAVGADVTLLWPPLPGDHAAAVLRSLLDGWRTGMQRPLPVAMQTALRWLEEDRKARDKGKEVAGAWDAAGKIYDGDDFSAGEVAKSAALARQYPDFAALTQDGEFGRWATQLYQPLLDASPQVLA